MDVRQNDKGRKLFDPYSLFIYLNKKTVIQNNVIKCSNAKNLGKLICEQKERNHVTCSYVRQRRGCVPELLVRKVSQHEKMSLSFQVIHLKFLSLRKQHSHIDPSIKRGRTTNLSS